MKKIGIILLSALVLTGCVQQINLTDEESETISSYAAYVTLQHDKNYGRKLVDTTETEQESETEEAVANDLDTQVTELENVNQGEAVQEELEESAEVEKVTDLATVFGLEGFQISYEGFVYAKKYEDIDRGFVASSTDDNLFLILKFKVENMTDETKECNISSKEPKLKVSVNGSESVETYGSIISNDMASIDSEIEAHASKDAVLLLEVMKEYENNVSDLSLEVDMDGKVYTVDLN